MLKKKTAGFKPKPKGGPVRRNAPGPSQGAEERQSQTPAPTPTPTPSASQQPTPAASIPQTPAAEGNLATPSSQVESTTQPSPVSAPEAPTPPPTAPVETTAVAEQPIATTNEVQRDTGVEEDGAAEDTVSDKPAPNEMDKDGETMVVTRPPTIEPVTAPAQEPTPAPATTTTTATLTPIATPAEPSQPAAKEPTTVRSRLPAGRPATAIRPPGAVTPSTSGPGATPAPTAAQSTQPVASAIPAHVQTIQTATPPDEPAAEPPADQPQPSIEATAQPENYEAPAAPAKAKRAPRKRKSAAETAEANGDAAPAPKRPRKKAAATPAEGDDTENGEGSQKAPARPKRVRVPIVRDVSEVQSGGEGSDAGVSERHPRKRGVRQRSVTPDDAEEQQVDMRQVKMGDLVKDLKIGKKFSRHEELLERERMKKLQAKMRAAGLDPENPDDDDDATQAASASGTPAPGGAASSSTAKKPAEATPSGGGLVSAAPQFQIIDGQIVVNQATLQFDRHAAAADAAGYMEEEEEDEFTHHTTQNSYRKKIQKPNHWNALDTEQFYEALTMFGTDFETIAKMFPGKNRRHLKLKFNREERANPARINSALIGERPEIDLEEFQKKAGLELRPTQEIMDEDKARGEAFEEEQRRVEEEAAAEEARKREALFSKGVKEGEEEQIKGRGRGRKRKMNAGGIGGLGG